MQEETAKLRHELDTGKERLEGEREALRMAIATHEVLIPKHQGSILRRKQRIEDLQVGACRTLHLLLGTEPP